MNANFPPDDSGSGGEPDREAHDTSDSSFVGGDQDRWQAPDAGAFTGVPSYPAPGSAAGPQYPGHGDYQTPPVGQPDYIGGSVPESAPYLGAPGYPGAPGDPGYPGYGDYTSVPVPKPSIIPLQPLPIGEILGEAFKSLHANPKAIFVPSLVMVSIVGLLSAGNFTLFPSRLGLPSLTSGEVELSDAGLDEAGASLVGLLVQLSATSVLSMMATSIIIDLLTMTVSRTILGHEASLGGVWQCTRSRVWALIGQTLPIELILAIITAVVTAIAVGIDWALLRNVITSRAAEDSAGTIILAILTILAVIAVLGLVIFTPMHKLCLAPAALVLENTSVMGEVSRSWTFTRGYFWHIVGIRLLSFIIVFFASQIVSQGVSIVMQGLLYAAPDTALAILVTPTLLSSLVQATILPFDSAMVMLIYADLRIRPGGLDTELRHAAGA